MTASFRLLALFGVILIGFLLATRVLPWLAVRTLRLVGFAARATPVTRKRIVRFKRIRRGYFAFLAVVTLFVLSLFLELLVNTRPLAIRYEDRTAFPAVAEWISQLPFVSVSPFQRGKDFGQARDSEVDYALFAKHAADPAILRKEIDAARAALAAERAKLEAEVAALPERQRKIHDWKFKRFARREAELEVQEKAHAVFAAGRAWTIPTLYPHSPSELRHDLPTNPPSGPSLTHGVPLGTDTSGRDVLSLLLYGFRISMAFALLVAGAGYLVGIVVGGVQGYFGGWTDIIAQRVEEIWSAIPFLFTIMIVASLLEKPSFLILAGLMIALRSWLGIVPYIRAEFYREKAKDYVQAAIGSGVTDAKIMVRHILPNSLVPLVTFAPFGIVGYIGALVSLDFLGFGLPPGTPSWGALLRQGLENVKFHPHLVIVPSVSLAVTLYAVVTIGEAVREAFDPKVFSRLR